MSTSEMIMSSLAEQLAKTLGKSDLQNYQASDYISNVSGELDPNNLQTGILLENVSSAQKNQLLSKIGAVMEGHSDFLFVATKTDASGNIIPCIVDSGTSNDYTSESAYATAELAADPNDQPADLPEGHIGIGDEPNTKSVVALSQEALDKAKADNFCNSVLRILDDADGSAKRSNDIPASAVHAYWLYNKTYDWPTSKGSEWEGFTPQAQSTYGAIDYRIDGYLDEPANGNRQWLYLTALGFWSTSGMNQDEYNETGWMIGKVGLEVPIPSDFAFIQSSPGNTNNESSVTTSASFQVSTKGEGTFTVGTSETKTLTDWETILSDLNDWNLRQSDPFDGDTRECPNSAFSYDFWKARWKVKDLPALSTNVYDFCTMSVWRNDKVSTSKVTIKPKVSLQYNYLACKSVMTIGYFYCWWNTNSKTESLSVDLSLISEPKS